MKFEITVLTVEREFYSIEAKDKGEALNLLIDQEPDSIKTLSNTIEEVKEIKDYGTEGNDD